MSKLEDIKHRIDELDGGTFQNLCDSYLNVKGYKDFYSLGMLTGTNKPAPGSPDTYFKAGNGKYIFAMYTTQKDSFVTKAVEDFAKCFDSDKTGIPAEDISEIIFCHTYGRLTPGEDKRLHDYCTERGALLTLIGLDTLGNDLYYKYPRLAKEYFGISVDTGQITSADNFVYMHDTNRTAAPLKTQFLFRNAEMEEAKTKLSETDVLLISGPAGVGKTRFALELCTSFAKEHDLELLCVKNNNLEIYEDLICCIDLGKNYIVLIDDANELTGLHFFLELLAGNEKGTRKISKIVITVRDYAKSNVMNKVLDYTTPKTLKMKPFIENEINELMKIHYGITNTLYLKRINSIAKGNARLAMLAGKIAAETNALSSIKDATELYNHYYKKQLDAITTSNRTEIKSAGIVAFLQAINFDNMNKFEPVFTSANLNSAQFLEDLHHLHELELVDISHDKAARISDQSFGNFLIKYVFVDKKIISLGLMIKICFFISKERTINACNILMNVFSDSEVIDYFESEVKSIWEELRGTGNKFDQFFIAFNTVYPEETFVLLKKYIDTLPDIDFDISSLDLKDNKNSFRSDEVIGILSSYTLSNEIDIVLDLLLIYFKKRPDLFMEFYTAFIDDFGITSESYKQDYYSTKKLIDKLLTETKNNHGSELTLLFVMIAKHYLKLIFNSAESTSGRSVNFYTIPLTASTTVIRYREKLWLKLLELYSSGCMCSEIEEILHDYADQSDSDADEEIIKADIENINKFYNMFDAENLYHCVIVNKINEIPRKNGADICEESIPFAESEKYKIYSTLKQKRINMFSDDAQNKQKACVSDLVSNYGVNDFENVMNVCSESLKFTDDCDYSMQTNIENFFDVVFERNEIFVEVVKLYLKADTPYTIDPAGIIEKLFTILTPDEVKRVILSCDYKYQNTWLWYYYAKFPKDLISVSVTQGLLNFLDTEPEILKQTRLRSLADLIKYEAIDKDIIIKACRTINDRYDEPGFGFRIYFTLPFSKYYSESDKIFNNFKLDPMLLESVYIKIAFYENYVDYDGTFLSKIIELDTNFLECYLDRIVELRSITDRQDAYVERLNYLWTKPNYENLITRIFIKIMTPSFMCGYFMNYILQHSEDPTISERKIKWIDNFIDANFSNELYMERLFESLSKLNGDIRKHAILHFISINDDPEIFEKLELEESGWCWCGSMIPIMQERIDYLESLLPHLSGLKFIRHKKKVEKDIERWKYQIKQEEISELLDLWND